MGSSARTETWLWIAQRASAAVLGLCVLVHLVTITLATQGGLSAAEILARTRGNAWWLGFYAMFVLACAIHVPIGLRSTFAEWLGWRGRSRDAALLGFAALIAVFGMRAILGVYL